MRRAFPGEQILARRPSHNRCDLVLSVFVALGAGRIAHQSELPGEEFPAPG
jgi:hypothetical protein